MDIDPVRLKGMDVEALIRFADSALNLHVDVNTTPAQMIGHIARNSVK